MEFQGISPSFGIEFDTHQNPSDETAEDHISFHKYGKIAELCTQNVNQNDIEDDSDYKVIIIWDPSSEHMAVFFDNESTPTLQMGFHISSIFESGETF